MAKPTSLYKYVRFSDKLLEQLCHDHVYYADPASFNDPLDCTPVVEADISIPELKEVLAQLASNRVSKEIDVAMRKLRLRGDKATERREKLMDSEVRRLIGEIDYNATEADRQEDQEAWIRNGLSVAIEEELRRAHETGVLCLCSKFDSPLMWSHYADQHRGVCLEYDTSAIASAKLHRVSYGRSRIIRASHIRDWLFRDSRAARKAVVTAALLTKSKEWRYEGEWRLLGPIGAFDTPVRLKSITFGMRCPLALKYTVVKTLENKPGVEYWEIVRPSDRFQLRRSVVDRDELMRELPRMSLYGEFEEMVEGAKVAPWAAL